jgi:hypothetical protein
MRRSPRLFDKEVKKSPVITSAKQTGKQPAITVLARLSETAERKGRSGMIFEGESSNKHPVKNAPSEKYFQANAASPRSSDVWKMTEHAR